MRCSDTKQDLSRNGAKAQSAAAFLKVFFASLRLCVSRFFFQLWALAILLNVAFTAVGQTRDVPRVWEAPLSIPTYELESTEPVSRGA